jgi:ribonucleoside-diphosphate reductase alpha chain
MRFDPAGLTDDPDVRMAQSVMDYLFRRLALDYLSEDERAELGIFTAEERMRQVSDTYGTSLVPAADSSAVDLDSLRSSAPVEQTRRADPTTSQGAAVGATPTAARSRLRTQTAVDAPLCFTCGVTMRPAGSCYVCEQCGSTSGCS